MSPASPLRAGRKIDSPKTPSDANELRQRLEKSRTSFQNSIAAAKNISPVASHLKSLVELNLDGNEGRY